MKKKGFTIAELLVVIAVVAVMGGVITEVFTRSLRGGNKSAIIGTIKQNGQASLENMDKTIRSSDAVVCPIISVGNFATSDTVVVVKDGRYNRFRYTAQVSNSANGYIIEDFPILPSGLPQGDITTIQNTFCVHDWVDPDSSNVPVIISDSNTKSGVSVSVPTGGNFITRDKPAGYKDTVTVNFALGPGVAAPVALVSQIDPVTFTTTIELR